MASRKLWLLCIGLYLFLLEHVLSADTSNPPKKPEEECRLLGKFDLRGYVDAEEAMHVIGGMFPIHFRTILEEDPTSTPPNSPKCEG